MTTNLKKLRKWFKNHRNSLVSFSFCGACVVLFTAEGLRYWLPAVADEVATNQKTPPTTGPAPDYPFQTPARPDETSVEKLIEKGLCPVGTMLVLKDSDLGYAGHDGINTTNPHICILNSKIHDSGHDNINLH